MYVQHGSDDGPPNTDFLGSVRGLQILLGAFAMGIVMFVVVAHFVQLEPVDPDSNILQYVLIGMVCLKLPVVLLIRKARFASAKSTIPEGATDEERDLHLIRIYAATTIVTAAIAEGSGLFGTVIFLLGGPKWVLGAPALAVLIIVSLIPTESRARAICAKLAGEESAIRLD
ncbi:MAG: hypothetical protein AAF517_27625 [Planctomycetota bacterium]